MKLRKLALVLVIVLLASTLAPALAKSPFADVPADHWAYDSIVELAAAGLIEGYPDGTYGGARMMTRYEAAMVFARALARLESRMDILPELDRVKAELAAEIKATLPVAEAPVETKVVEKVIIDRDVNDEALARIRATEIAAEALEGDIAYVENRVLGLVDGIRYDINTLQEQVDGLEIPSLDEIEALIAEQIEAALLAGAQDVVHETTVIERVVVTDPELTEEDVELIAEELITKRLQNYSRFIMDVLAADVEELNKRIDALEAAQADLASKDELAAVEADVAAVKSDVDAVKADVKDLQKVRIGGTLSLGGKYAAPEAGEPKEYSFNSNATLNLNIKASDTVGVKATFGMDKFANLEGGKVAVTSEGPIKSLTVGKWAGGRDVIGIGHPYVLGDAKYDLAGVADLDLIDGLTAKALLGMNDKTEPVVAGLAFDYKFIDELGVKVAFAGQKEPMITPEAKAVGAGIYGKVAGVTYGGNFAMDLTAEADEGESKENTIFDVGLEFGVGPLKLDGKYINKAANYGVANPFVKLTGKDAGNAIEMGAGTDFLLGIDLKARYYREIEAEAEDAAISAFNLTAAKDFDLGLPIKVSAGYVSNKKDGAEDGATQLSAKVALAPKAPDFGFRYGASLGYVKGEYEALGNWKNGKIDEELNVTTIDGNVGYKFDWRGATLDLGYAANFRMPVRVKENEDNEAGPNKLTHKLSVGYNFTKDVKLTLGSTIVQEFEEPVENDFTYNAGLTTSF